jgi:hypothetical protein
MSSHLRLLVLAKNPADVAHVNGLQPGNCSPGIAAQELQPKQSVRCPHKALCVCLHADDDGFITFEEFMVSYARPKPILKNLLIMAVNTAIIYFILQAPFLDTMIKVGGSVSAGLGFRVRVFQFLNPNPCMPAASWPAVPCIWLHL